MKYKYIIIPIITLMLAQVIKFLIETIQNKEFRLERLFNGNGGMPSTHTAFTMSLAISVGIGEGFDSALFATSLIFAIIVAYDSMGLRMESGKQAVMINKINKHLKFEEEVRLKEMLGHKPLEVFAGIIFGILSAMVQMNIFA